MNPTPSPSPVRRRGPQRRKSPTTFFGTPAPVVPEVQNFTNPDAAIQNAVRDLQNDEENRNNPAVIITQPTPPPTPRNRSEDDPTAAHSVIPRRPKPQYNIEEEVNDNNVNQFFEDAFANINQDIAQIASRFFGRNYGTGDDEGAFFRSMNLLLSPALRASISFLADGDVGCNLGRDGWQTIFGNGQEREYLFRGILHRYLEETVFDQLLFGSNEGQEDIYSAQETTFISDNGM